MQQGKRRGERDAGSGVCDSSRTMSLLPSSATMFGQPDLSTCVQILRYCTACAPVSKRSVVPRSDHHTVRRCPFTIGRIRFSADPMSPGWLTTRPWVPRRPVARAGRSSASLRHCPSQHRPPEAHTHPLPFPTPLLATCSLLGHTFEPTLTRTTATVRLRPCAVASEGSAASARVRGWRGDADARGAAAPPPPSFRTRSLRPTAARLGLDGGIQGCVLIHRPPIHQPRASLTPSPISKWTKPLATTVVGRREPWRMRELASSIGRMLHGWKNYLGLRWRNEREGLSLCSKRRDPLTGSSASPGVLLYVGAKREAALRDFHQSARTWDAFVEVAHAVVPHVAPPEFAKFAEQTLFEPHTETWGSGMCTLETKPFNPGKNSRAALKLLGMQPNKRQASGTGGLQNLQELHGDHPARRHMEKIRNMKLSGAYIIHTQGAKVEFTASEGVNGAIVFKTVCVLSWWGKADGYEIPADNECMVRRWWRGWEQPPKCVLAALRRCTPVRATTRR